MTVLRRHLRFGQHRRLHRQAADARDDQFAADTLIGKLLKTVDSLDPNTYVIYHGRQRHVDVRQAAASSSTTCTSRASGAAKAPSTEAGSRVEFAIRGPGIKPGSVSDTPITTTDLAPTILELAGLTAPKMVPGLKEGTSVPMDGVTLTPILFKGARQIRDPYTGYLLAETTNPIKNNIREAGARNAQYKIICDENADANSCTFYDLLDDPIEEYPLPKPASCNDYGNGKLKPKDRDWNFCRLQEVIATRSFLGWKK